MNKKLQIFLKEITDETEKINAEIQKLNEDISTHKAELENAKKDKETAVLAGNYSLYQDADRKIEYYTARITAMKERLYQYEDGTAEDKKKLVERITKEEEQVLGDVTEEIHGQLYLKLKDAEGILNEYESSFKTVADAVHKLKKVALGKSYKSPEDPVSKWFLPSYNSVTNKLLLGVRAFQQNHRAKKTQH